MHAQRAALATTVATGAALTTAASIGAALATAVAAGSTVATAVATGAALSTSATAQPSAPAPPSLPPPPAAFAVARVAAGSISRSATMVHHGRRGSSHAPVSGVALAAACRARRRIRRGKETARRDERKNRASCKK